jgi:putative transposase
MEDDRIRNHAFLHVHFFINAPTNESAADIARWVKGRAFHHLRKEFPELKKLPALWTPTYFVATTGQVSTEVVKKYIENQRGK